LGPHDGEFGATTLTDAVHGHLRRPLVRLPRRLPYAARSAPISAPAATGPATPISSSGAHRPGRSGRPSGTAANSGRGASTPAITPIAHSAAPVTAPGTRRPDAPSTPPPARSRRR
jgi:hypothetical protein